MGPIGGADGVKRVPGVGYKDLRGSYWGQDSRVRIRANFQTVVVADLLQKLLG